MNDNDRFRLTELSMNEAAEVHGAGLVQLAQAQDVWGNTMSHEEWMDRKIRQLYDSTTDPHDFYDDGYDSDKPNIYNP